MVFTLFGTEGLEFGNGTTIGRPKEKKCVVVWGNHFPQVEPEALIILVSLTIVLSRELIIFGRSLGATPLNLQIYLHDLHKVLAALTLAVAGSSAIAKDRR
ncbi:hypothetical protein AAZX31_09G098800 [Glycine max]